MLSAVAQQNPTRTASQETLCQQGQEGSLFSFKLMLHDSDSLLGWRLVEKVLRQQFSQPFVLCLQAFTYVFHFPRLLLHSVGGILRGYRESLGDSIQVLRAAAIGVE